jgi:Zn-dependent M16 (insulinase) family peptidase
MSKLDFIERLVTAIKDGGSFAGKAEIHPLGIKNEGILIPSQVSYAAAADNVLLEEKPCGAQIVARSIVSYAHLWNTVRVQGGAYGAGLVVRRNGFLAFYSYRDPSPRRTFDCYVGSGDFLRGFVDSGEPLEKFIIGAFGDYDVITTPRSAGARAAVNALRGWSDEMEKNFREEIISTSRASLLHVAELLDKVNERGAVCVIGPESALDSCADILKARLEI